MDDTSESVVTDEDDPEAAPEPGRRPRWPWVVGTLVIALVAGLLFIPLPYILYEPGSARPTGERVEITGHQAFTSQGQILFLTVSEEKATAATLARAWLDDSIDIEDEDVVNPPGGPDAYRAINQARMDESKFLATSLAFRVVGYPVNEVGAGAFVEQVLPGYPASKVLTQGDVITSVDGTAVTTRDGLSAALKGKPAGTEVLLGITNRHGTARTATVELGRNANDPSRGYLGILPTTYQRDLDLPFPIEIDSGAVTGPSAGLAFTLGVIDRLTPGDLASGRKIAVTGTIDEEGNVGPIGGIAQKAVALKDAGATVFIYPADTPKADVKRVKGILGKSVEMHPVSTLGEALKILAPDGLQPAPPLG